MYLVGGGGKGKPSDQDPAQTRFRTSLEVSSGRLLPGALPPVAGKALLVLALEVAFWTHLSLLSHPGCKWGDLGVWTETPPGPTSGPVQNTRAPGQLPGTLIRCGVASPGPWLHSSLLLVALTCLPAYLHHTRPFSEPEASAC